MKSIILSTLLSLLSSYAMAQSFSAKLFDNYDSFKEESLSVRRTKHADIQPLIASIASKKGFKVTKVGESIEGRDISLISIGSGDIDIFLWSQMHGNEPTATHAIFDIINFLADKKEFKSEKKEMLGKVKLHFLPMLNPDGAQQYKRRNALNIDINRDALRLQSPEGRILKRVRDSLDADYGFNLHDQSIYYNAERSDKPATISYLAPAYNYEKSINDVRGDAMKIIVYMNNIIQQYAPGQVGRYNDDFEPRAFGDNIQKWGTRTILIESGGYTNDPEKQFIRKLNYMSILASIFTISEGSYKDIDITEYENIPFNDRKLFDLKIENLTYTLLGEDYVLDLGIHTYEIDNEEHDDFHYRGRISDIGDLSTFYGYKTIDAKGLKLEEGLVISGSLGDIKTLNIDSLLALGITTLRIDSIPEDFPVESLPINITTAPKAEYKELKIGRSASFVLKKEDEVVYVIVNGFVFNNQDGTNHILNGIIK